MDWFKHKTYDGRRIPYRLSKAILIRDKYTCQYCGKVAVSIIDSGVLIRAMERVMIKGDTFTFPFEIDHIKPKVLGGLTRYDNLRLSCRRCNRSKCGKGGFGEMV